MAGRTVATRRSAARHFGTTPSRLDDQQNDLSTSILGTSISTVFVGSCSFVLVGHGEGAVIHLQSLRLLSVGVDKATC